MNTTQPNNSEQDYDALLDPMLTLVEKCLQEYGDFVPCGSVITTEGEIVGVAVTVDDSTTVESAMHMVFDRIKSQANERRIRASCVCYNGSVEDKGETIPAIIIILEHLHGPAMILRRPYQKDANGTYLYAQLEGERGVRPEIFAET